MIMLLSKVTEDIRYLCRLISSCVVVLGRRSCYHYCARLALQVGGIQAACGGDALQDAINRMPASSGIPWLLPHGRASLLLNRIFLATEYPTIYVVAASSSNSQKTRTIDAKS